MTQNRRIVLNALATYARTLYQVAVGIFSGRWVLMSLGQVDYGLMGVVGGLTVFIVYLNNIIVSAVVRYYGLSIGEEQKNPELGLEHARMWFTTAVMVQTIIPLILFLIGYPIGEWAVRHYLTIPPERVVACVWVWRFTCGLCFLGQISIPMNAMYGAKQYIAELTIYSFVSTTLNLGFVCYMVTHPGDWLVRYSLWGCLLGLVPMLIINIRAFYLFPECRFLRRYAFCWHNFKGLLSFAFWNAWGSLGGVLRRQGMAILTNRYFGPVVNAAMAVGTGLSGNTLSLSSSVTGAFAPVIVSAWGSGDYDRARTIALRSCKLGALLILIFALPLSIEVQNVLVLWLKNPPQYAALFCVFVMAESVLNTMSTPHVILVNANGKIAAYQAVLGTSLVLTLPVAWVLIKFGFGVWAICLGSISMMTFCSFGRVWFARRLVGMNMLYWMRRVFVPLLVVSVLSLLIGAIPKCLLPSSLWRVVVTTIVIELFLLPFSWFFILTTDERLFLKGKFGARLANLGLSEKGNEKCK